MQSVASAGNLLTGNQTRAQVIQGAKAPAKMAKVIGKDSKELTQDEKDTITNIITLATASTAYAITDGDVAGSVSATEVGRVGVGNNATFIDQDNFVKKVILNGDKGIYKCNFKNNECIDRPVKIGESMFEDAFISPDTGKPVGRVYIGESIDGYIYNLNKEAENDTRYTVAWKSLPYNEYIYNMGDYDIKKSFKNGEIKTYHGYLFHGHYITLREGGNILAGMNAATLGVPYDEFQKASSALHAGGTKDLIKYKTTGYTYGTYPRYGEKIISI